VVRYTIEEANADITSGGSLCTRVRRARAKASLFSHGVFHFVLYVQYDLNTTIVVGFSYSRDMWAGRHLKPLVLFHESPVSLYGDIRFLLEPS
jgi:hypothetical protein